MIQTPNPGAGAVPAPSNIERTRETEMEFFYGKSKAQGLELCSEVIQRKAKANGWELTRGEQGTRWVNTWTLVVPTAKLGGGMGGAPTPADWPVQGERFYAGTTEEMFELVEEPDERGRTDRINPTKEMWGMLR